MSITSERRVTVAALLGFAALAISGTAAAASQSTAAGSALRSGVLGTEIGPPTGRAACLATPLREGLAGPQSCGRLNKKDLTIRGLAMSALGQTLQVAFNDASGQVRSDPKADLIPVLQTTDPSSSVSVTEEDDYAR